MQDTRVLVAGAGLAGCEAAWALAEAGVPVRLLDCKPGKMSPAHRSSDFGELVCSNSLKAARLDSAAGLQRVARRILGKRIQPSLHQAAFVAVERADWKQAAGLRPRELRLFCGTGPRAAGLYGAIQPYQGEEAPHGLCPAVCGGLLFI